MASRSNLQKSFAYNDKITVQRENL